MYTACRRLLFWYLEKSVGVPLEKQLVGSCDEGGGGRDDDDDDGGGMDGSTV